MCHFDADRLIDLVKDRHSDPEALAHLETCDSCRTQYQLLREVAVVLRPGPPTPKHRVDVIMAAVRSSSLRSHRSAPGSLIWSWALGAATTVLALLFTGSLGAGVGSATILFLGFFAGLAAALTQKAAVGRLRTEPGLGST